MSNSLTRRGFLGAISAFVGAMSAGVSMPTAIAKAPPRREQLDVLEILKDCRAQSVSVESIVADISRVKIVYRYAPNAPRTSLDEMADAHRAGKLPVSVSVTVETQAIGLAEFGELYSQPVCKSVSFVEIDFI